MITRGSKGSTEYFSTRSSKGPNCSKSSRSSKGLNDTFQIPGSSSGSVKMKTEAQIFLARSSSSRLPFQAKNRSFVATNKFLFRPKNDRGVNSRLDLGTFPGHSCRFKKQVPENWSGFSPAQHFPECHSSKMNMMGDHLEALGKARV